MKRHVVRIIRTVLGVALIILAIILICRLRVLSFSPNLEDVAGFSIDRGHAQLAYGIFRYVFWMVLVYFGLELGSHRRWNGSKGPA